jgi:hypothetical protein
MYSHNNQRDGILYWNTNHCTYYLGAKSLLPIIEDEGERVNYVQLIHFLDSYAGKIYTTNVINLEVSLANYLAPH